MQEHALPPEGAVVQQTGEMKDRREEKRGTSPAVAFVNPLVERLVGGHQPVYINGEHTLKTKKTSRVT